MFRLFARYSHFDSKYSQKLNLRAQQSGTSVQALKDNLRVPKSAPQSAPQPPTQKSPIKPLSSILNLDRIHSTEHTAAQVDNIWTAYHASRSALSATLPLTQYQDIVHTARSYPSFLVPLTRPSQSQDAQDAYEFYFLQWAFYPSSSSTPPSSTVLFTPLVEYKLRGDFATPYLVLTFYPELASSHRLVLLRGEITPTTNQPSNRSLISLSDAQLLAMQLQKFYLWHSNSDSQSQPDNSSPTSPQSLLRAFHESPAEFKWEHLLEHANVS